MAPLARLRRRRPLAGACHRPPGGRLSPLAYGTIESPLGDLVAAVSPRGLARIALPTDDADALLARTAARLDLDLVADAARVAPVREQLDEYFAGDRRVFELPLDLSTASGFHRTVLEHMAEIPYGRVLTYSELAAEAGRPRAARAAGHAGATNPIPVIVPCHRVVRRDGGLGGYSSGLDDKRFLLRLEGVDPDAL